MPSAIMIAFTSPTSVDTEVEYNRWYNEKHLCDVAAIEGVKSACRYRIVHDVETLPGVGGPTQRYLAIYEVEANDEKELDLFCGRLREALATGRADISPALDMSDLGATLALPISGLVSGVSAGGTGGC